MPPLGLGLFLSTRFVLRKALERGLRAVLVVNKVDRDQSRPEYALDKTFDLFTELGASDEQMNFQTVYASGLQGIAGTDPKNLSVRVRLFEFSLIQRD